MIPSDDTMQGCWVGLGKRLAVDAAQLPLPQLALDPRLVLRRRPSRAGGDERCRP